MDWKEFIKPTFWKVLLALIIFLVIPPFYYNVGACPMNVGSDCKLGFSLMPLAGSFIIFQILMGNRPNFDYWPTQPGWFFWYGTLIFNLLFSYAISGLVFYAVQKLKSKSQSSLA